LEIGHQQFQAVWRIARSQAGNIGAAALALILAVGLSSAIFTAGGWRPMLAIAPDSQLDQMTTPPSAPMVEEAREILLAPVAKITRQPNREARSQRPIAVRAPGRKVCKQSPRQGQQFIVSTVLRLLRHRNHLIISKLFGNDGD
jgi:hypothetical protein